MANIGDSYTVTLKESHLGWGTHRYTDTRDQICGEGYIPIPSKYAHRFGLLNNNGTDYMDILGQNLFNCTSADGFFEGVLRAQGCRKAGDKYAKQFSVDGDLKALGNWFYEIGAEVGDEIEVSWTSPTDIVIEKI